MVENQNPGGYATSYQMERLLVREGLVANEIRARWMVSRLATVLWQEGLIRLERRQRGSWRVKLADLAAIEIPRTSQAARGLTSVCLVALIDHAASGQPWPD